MSPPFNPDWADKWRWRTYSMLIRAYLHLVRRGPLHPLAAWWAKRGTDRAIAQEAADQVTRIGIDARLDD
jgi:hypothetical protein